MNESAMLKTIVEGEWIRVLAMVPPRRREILLDLVFVTDKGEARLTGKAHALQGKSEEAFSLAIFEHSREGWWAANAAGQTKWAARELSNEWSNELFMSVLTGPRQAQFYTDPELKNRSIPAKCLLDDCAAMELESRINPKVPGRIVIAASRSVPCAIEIATSPDTCQALLAGLDRIALAV